MADFKLYFVHYYFMNDNKDLVDTAPSATLALTKEMLRKLDPIEEADK